MDSTEEFLAGLGKLSDPGDRWRRMRQYEPQDDDRIKEAMAWWKARYRFVDKKQKRTADRFVWLLLCLSSNSSPRQGDKKAVCQAYTEALLSPETKTATALSDRLYEEMLDASTIFIRTISPYTSILGITLTKDPDEATTLARIGGNVAGKLIPAVYRLCRELPYADQVTRALFQGAKVAYPGIQPTMMDVIQEYKDKDVRAYVLDCVRPEGL